VVALTTTVSAAPSFPLKSSQSFILGVRPLTRTSGVHDGSSAQPSSGLLVRFVCRPLGLLGWMASPYTWGSFNRATRGHSRPPCQAGSFPNAFTGRRLLCFEHWSSQPRFGVVLDRGFGFTASASKTPAGRPLLLGLDNSKRVVETSTWESAVLVGVRALSGNASVVGCRASW